MNIDAQLVEHMMSPKNYGTLTSSPFDFSNCQENQRIELMEYVFKHFTKDTNA